MALSALTAPAVAATDGGASAQGYACSNGKFCIYSGWDGTGEVCEFIPPVANTVDTCGFIRNSGNNVLSVRNLMGYKVQYYKGTNYGDRVGSTPSNGNGNLQGNYQIRSLKRQ
ncbi:peptidase inhibitor family I36 protein [Streptomyces sp. NPDC001941]|uniref:peptidase inhibitor family I36 protein n=1 Tax=Streptomyces sp. NPDC001941 TaxID=3154659 RepID=UPI0033333889